MTKFAGIDWIAEQSVVKARHPKISKFGIQVADILGQVFQGIYHLANAVLSERVDWSNNREITITIWKELATYDFPELSILLMCCLHKGISFEIKGSFKDSTRVTFLNRKTPYRLGSDLIQIEDKELLAGDQKAFDLMRQIFSTERSKTLWERQRPDVICCFTRPNATMDEIVLMVALAHHNVVRIGLIGRSPQTLALTLSKRQRKGTISARHPTWAEAIEMWQRYWNF